MSNETPATPSEDRVRFDGNFLDANDIRAAGGTPLEINTVAINDGITTGTEGMKTSLVSRELIADSVEYMCNAHTADAMVCISNCDKITPGMLMAAMRINIPVVFVSGGPMEAGKVIKVVDGAQKIIKLDLVDAMIKAGDSSVSDADVAEIGRNYQTELGVVADAKLALRWLMNCWSICTRPCP